MNNDKILEIARRHLKLTWVNDDPEELIAFAQSVIEASQKPLTDEQISQLASGLSDAYGYHLTTETIIRKTQALLLGERV